MQIVPIANGAIGAWGAFKPLLQRNECMLLLFKPGDSRTMTWWTLPTLKACVRMQTPEEVFRCDGWCPCCFENGQDQPCVHSVVFIMFAVQLDAVLPTICNLAKSMAVSDIAYT